MANKTDFLLKERILELEKSFGITIDAALKEVEKNKEQIRNNFNLYYHEKKDQKDKQRYYKQMFKTKGGQALYSYLHQLLEKTHEQKLPYFISKDQYLYTWVDLQPDGTLKSIYSGLSHDPKKLIIADFNIIQRKYAEFHKLLLTSRYNNRKKKESIPKIDQALKFNTEHIVPLSWYSAKEPMKGDLHHLFACQPECNIKRSNYPYADFSFYVPESPQEKIQNHCGVTMDGLFEPEYGKGTVARAMMYFLLRYPGVIHRKFRKKIDYALLLRWHKEFPVTLYEKHRNQAIYEIQGNRNPFIDFPELVEKLYKSN